MPIVVQCQCGRVLKARDEFAGSRAECPTCGEIVEIPASAKASTSPEPEVGRAGPTAVREYLDPPTWGPKTHSGGGTAQSANPSATADLRQAAAAAVAAPPPIPVMRRMFEALLDPRAIQWMLMIGGGLCVLGIIVWLVSQGVFDDPRIMAVALGVGTLAILGAGWFTALKTRFRIAGQALTFLGCVVAPLNLWFYHAQDLLTVDGRLWVGGVVCCLLYAATVRVLRDPLFMYACEAGVTLTAVLLLADLGKITDATWLSLFLMALGLISIHAERAFAPDDSAEFSRKRYGLPLFWSGQVQLAASLIILLGSQLLGWFVEPATTILGWTWQGNLLTTNHVLAAAIWLAAAYAYLYSDIVVRRVGVYFALAGFSLMMAETTLLLGFVDGPEWIIAAMAVTSVGITIAQKQLGGKFPQLDRFVPPAALALAAVAVIWGGVLHVRATSPAAADLGWGYAETGSLAATMLVAAVAARVSAFFTRRTNRHHSAAYFALSAAAVLIATASLLRLMGYTAWTQQAPLMMLIPLGYLIASRLWRGHSAEWPLYWVAQAATAVILLHVFGTSVESWRSFVQMDGQYNTLMLALVFAEAAVFYTLAAVFQRRSVNVHLAAAAACGALWQFMGYYGVPSQYYTMLYAGLGVVGLVVGRTLGLEQVDVYRFANYKAKAIRGRGLAAFQCGNGILCVALLAAFMQGLAGLALRGGEPWVDVTSLAVTIAAAGFAALVVPAENWRRFYWVAATGLAGVLFLRLNMLVDLTGWQKLEIFSVAAGVIMLAASHVAKFREADGVREDSVSFGLSLGSVLATVPLLVAVLYHRWVGGTPSMWDEIALLTVTMLMTVTGMAWQVKSTTMWGGASLVTYLVVLVCSLAYHPSVAVGVYLAAGGAVVFGLGVALSVYRERLLELPELVAKREGVFRILNWR
jgi:hypothetical protein